MIKIAYMFNMSVHNLQRINDCNDHIYPGQMLKIIDNQNVHSEKLVNEEEMKQKELSDASLQFEQDYFS